MPRFDGTSFRASRALSAAAKPVKAISKAKSAKLGASPSFRLRPGSSDLGWTGSCEEHELEGELEESVRAGRRLRTPASWLPSLPHFLFSDRPAVALGLASAVQLACEERNAKISKLSASAPVSPPPSAPDNDQMGLDDESFGGGCGGRPARTDSSLPLLLTSPPPYLASLPRLLTSPPYLAS